MTQSIKFAIQVQISNGPNVSISDEVEAEAYDNIKINVATGASDLEVEVQPGGSGQVQFLLISSETYSSDLTFKVNNAGNPAVEIDKPHIYAGLGAVAQLDSAPGSLFLSNASADDIEVSLLVGRDATP